MKTTVFTHFSKAVADHFGLSFGRSAKDNCDRMCRLWSICYAARIERIYKGLNAKLRRHWESGPLWVIARAMTELERMEAQAKRLDWARLSVDGSLPSREDVPSEDWSGFVAGLRSVVQSGLRLGAKWHIPVESPGKARTYRAALSGLGVIVRRTSQARSVAELVKQTDHRAWVVAESIHDGCISKAETARNTELANQAARQIRSSGQTCVICPAITRDSKCGKCTACSDGRVDVVLYPLHA